MILRSSSKIGGSVTDKVEQVSLFSVWMCTDRSCYSRHHWAVLSLVVPRKSEAVVLDQATILLRFEQRRNKVYKGLHSDFACPRPQNLIDSWSPHP